MGESSIIDQRLDGLERSIIWPVQDQKNWEQHATISRNQIIRIYHQILWIIWHYGNNSGKHNTQCPKIKLHAGLKGEIQAESKLLRSNNLSEIMYLAE